MEPVRTGCARRCDAACRPATLADRPVRPVEPAPARAGRRRDDGGGGTGGGTGAGRPAYGATATPRGAGGHRVGRHADGRHPARRPRGRDPARRPPILPRRCRRALGGGGRQRYAVRRASHPFLVEPLRGVGRQAGSDRPGRRVRIRRDPSACPRPLPRPADRRRTPSGDVAVSRPGAVDRPRQPGRPAPQWWPCRPQRKPRARDTGTAYAGRADRLCTGGRHRTRPRADRLDGCRP